jgi:aspartate dehydrogenase
MSLRAAIAGLGAIGWPVARALHEGIPGLRLTAIAAGRPEIAARRLAEAGIKAPVVAAAELGMLGDIVIDCAPAPTFRSVAESALTAGRMLVTVNGAALLEAPDIVSLAGQKTARIILVTGALLGLDAVRAAAEGKIHSVRMISRKPPTSLRGAPYLAANNIAIETIDRPTRIFSGSAREGARGFPANVNVAAALSLAGIGPDRTALEIWADPTVTRNIHTIEVDSDSARFTMTIENEPSAENPATSRIAPLSVIATLRRLGASLSVGT